MLIFTYNRENTKQNGNLFYQRNTNYHYCELYTSNANSHVVPDVHTMRSD